MRRVQVRFLRSGMTLARPVTAPDGATVVGVGTRLVPAVARVLDAYGVRSVWVESAEPVAPWEEDPEPDEALARLEARFPPPRAGALAEVYACLRERLVAHARGLDGKA